MPISVDLGAKLEEAVAELVSEGRYGSKSEVLREGVRLVQEREKRFADLRAKLEAGLAEADAGMLRPADEVFDRLRAKYEAMAK
ncbi:MAG: type II toxin-antitoxin system ParD family antitoxin [Micropepsaceae bacterium]